MKIFKNLWIAIIPFLLLIGIWESRQLTLKNLKVNQSTTATIFIPGYGGNQISTNATINHLNNFHIATKTLRIHVKKDGSIYKTKQFNQFSKNNPTIQLLFDNNKNPKLEANQMVNVMHYLYNKYNIKKINFVGHSSGANIAYDYLIRNSKTSKVPTPQKFISFASNFSKTPQPNYQNIPKQLQILNLVGEIKHSRSDSEIPLNTTKNMEKLVKPFVKSYQYKIYRGNYLQAEHSMLHENPAVDKIIAEFLFK
ncbi:alpha/beta hydrolase [Lactobacillus sp. S2-2]|uniref:alpha/beta hydrolase n=1 Tax=Lactobacillus sp. S2-2 TaxID=2692917 RepID=UPI001F207117|nr:alpha/beta hydrolase [Lactobacillus sp. S2-2]MCF6515265.1 alpha/beta hydrolase [Lactobacillus sp. S2-2]